MTIWRCLRHLLFRYAFASLITNFSWLKLVLAVRRTPVRWGKGTRLDNAVVWSCCSTHMIITTPPICLTLLEQGSANRVQVYGRLKLVLMIIPFPEVCHERLVVFFTDFAVSIVPALVSATPRGDLGRWGLLFRLCSHNVFLFLCHNAFFFLPWFSFGF